MAKLLRAGSVRAGVAFAVLAVAAVGCVLVTDFDDYHLGSAMGSGGAAGGSICGPGSAGGAQGGCGALGSSESCAYCGHDCLNGSCVNGTCTAGQVGTLAGFGLVADDTHLFFRTETGDTVYRIAKTAQELVSPEPLFSGPNAAWTLWVDGQHLYASTAQFLVRVGKDGFALEVLVTMEPPENRANGLIVDGDHLYYTSSYPPALRRILLTEAPRVEETVAESESGAGLVVDSEAIYFAVPGSQGASNGAIMRFSKSSLGVSNTAQVIAANIEQPWDLVAVDNNLYVSSNSQVLRVPKGGGGTPTVIADVQSRIAALSTDGCELYVAAGLNDANGRVLVMSLDGTQVRELHSGKFVFLGGIAGDRAAVFHGGATGIFRIVR